MIFQNSSAVSQTSSILLWLIICEIGIYASSVSREPPAFSYGTSFAQGGTEGDSSTLQRLAWVGPWKQPDIDRSAEGQSSGESYSNT